MSGDRRKKVDKKNRPNSHMIVLLRVRPGTLWKERDPAFRFNKIMSNQGTPTKPNTGKKN